jgi:hypothetical protein
VPSGWCRMKWDRSSQLHVSVLGEKVESVAHFRLDCPTHGQPRADVMRKKLQDTLGPPQVASTPEGSERKMRNLSII